ncbi:hypothetical protein BC938DRAFT_472037 [Jimgerdemannia flammicorona]|uniref:Uncharacterized protein n=1 Tax=Jimgerdemannia flammicorona TaxID=994334 RepID=A0A433Q6X0_9FUNG|nr:hypothetical protein BC938DRAFT_472037 [Jimgerdemannia flammicorona]
MHLLPHSSIGTPLRPLTNVTKTLNSIKGTLLSTLLQTAQQMHVPTPFRGLPAPAGKAIPPRHTFLFSVEFSWNADGFRCVGVLCAMNCFRYGNCHCIIAVIIGILAFAILQV